MGIPLAAVGGKITAYLFNLVVKQVNSLALTGIVPDSATGTGVTVAPGGAVTFINSPAVSVNGVFSGTFDSYRILIQSNNRSSGSSTQFHLRSAGADIGSQYFYTKTVSSGTSVAVTSSTSGSAVPLDDGIAAGQFSFTTIDIVYPADAVQTLGTVTSTNVGTGATSAVQVSIGNYGTQSCDGFSIYPLTGSATFSGIVRVYGYNSLA